MKADDNPTARFSLGISPFFEVVVVFLTDFGTLFFHPFLEGNNTEGFRI